MLESLFPGLSRPMIAVALSAYTDLKKDRWHVEYHRTSNNPYYIMAYRDGQRKDSPRRLHVEDFDTIKRYLNDALRDRHIVMISDKMIENRGHILITEYRQRWLLINTFFGIHPEYYILGLLTRYDHVNFRYETVYMVTDDVSRSTMAEKDIVGLFMFMLAGKIPHAQGVDHGHGPRFTLIGDLSRTLPIETDVLEKMKKSPVTVKELAERINVSETLIRFAINRLYVRGLVKVIGHKEGKVGRSPYLYQITGTLEEKVENSPTC